MLKVEWLLKIFSALLHTIIIILRFAEFINPRGDYRLEMGKYCLP